MKEIYEAVNRKLGKKGLSTIEVRRIIKDVINIVHQDVGFTHGSVSQRLQALGWQKQILDRGILDLIVWLAEDGNPCLAQHDGFRTTSACDANTAHKEYPPAEMMIH